MDNTALRAIRGDCPQREFASRLGVTVEHLSRMENGHRPVGGMVRARLALVRIEKVLEGRVSPTAVEIRGLVEEGLK